MRDDVLLSLVDRVMADKAFRDRARSNLDGALEDAGFQLSPEELDAVRGFHASAAGMSDAELDAALSSSGRRQFPGGN